MLIKERYVAKGVTAWCKIDVNATPNLVTGLDDTIIDVSGTFHYNRELRAFRGIINRVAPNMDRTQNRLYVLNFKDVRDFGSPEALEYAVRHIFKLKGARTGLRLYLTAQPRQSTLPELYGIHRHGIP